VSNEMGTLSINSSTLLLGGSLIDVPATTSCANFGIYSVSTVLRLLTVIGNHA